MDKSWLGNGPLGQAGWDEESWEKFAQHLDQIDEENEFGNLKPEDQMKKFYKLLEDAAELTLQKKQEFFRFLDKIFKPY